MNYRRFTIWMIGLLLVAAPSLAEKSAKSVNEKANEAYREGKYEQAVKLYEQAVELPEDADVPRMFLQYNLACCHSLLGHGAAGFMALEKAVYAGFSNRRSMDADRDFEHLKVSNPERFAGLLTACDENFAREKLEQSPVAVLEHDAYLGTYDGARMRWDDPRGPELTELRTAYNLDSVAAAGTTEFETFLAVLNWASTRWDHDGGNDCPEDDALGILKLVAEGQRFRCVEFGIVTANALTALGYPARVVGLQCEGVAYGYGKGHVIAEVWSNEYQKWIALDGQNNAFWRANGVPLSSAECRDYFVHGREDSLELVGRTPGWDYSRMRGEWVKYFYHVSIGDQHIYYPQPGAETPKGTQYVLDGNGTLPELFFQKSPVSWRQVDDAAFLYPPLNRVRISFGHVNKETASDTFAVRLEHTAPFFDHFLVRLNGGEWQTRAAEFVWALVPGENVVEAKAVNARGVEGKVARVRLRNNLRGMGNR